MFTTALTLQQAL